MRAVCPASSSLMATCTLVPSADGSRTVLTYPSEPRLRGLFAISITLIMLRMLPEFEGDGHRHHHRHRLSIEQRRRETPLTHGFLRRIVEQRNRSQNSDVAHRAVFANHRLENHDPLDMRESRELRIHGRNVRDLLRRPDVAADANWSCWTRRRGRVGIDESAVAGAEADE